MKGYVLFFFSVLFLIPVISQASEIERIQKAGVITVALNRDYPPFSLENRAPSSAWMWIWPTCWQRTSTSRCASYGGTYDHADSRTVGRRGRHYHGGDGRTVQRALLVNFSTPYFEVSQAALVRRDKVPADAKAYFDLLEIKSLRLGVRAGTTHEDFARQLFPATAIKLYPTAAAAAEAVVRGEVDAMVADSPFVRVWHNTHVEHYTAVTALLEPVTREFYAFAIRKGDADFLSWLNVFVEEIKSDGTLDLLVHEYFEQMAWAAKPGEPPARQDRAEFLKNRFIIDKKARIEQRRRAFQGKGNNYE